MLIHSKEQWGEGLGRKEDEENATDFLVRFSGILVYALNPWPSMFGDGGSEIKIEASGFSMGKTGVDQVFENSPPYVSK